ADGSISGRTTQSHDVGVGQHVTVLAEDDARSTTGLALTGHLDRDDRWQHLRGDRRGLVDRSGVVHGDALWAARRSSGWLRPQRVTEVTRAQSCCATDE